MKLSEKKPTANRRILVFGPPKSGKTKLVGELATKFKLKYFDLENGYKTLLMLPPALQENIELISLPDTRIYPVAVETMLHVIQGTRKEICEEHGKVSCTLCKKDSKPFTAIELNTMQEDEILVVDSLTQLAISTIANITKGQGDDYKYDWDDYRKQGTIMDKILSSFQQARYNVICITHETEADMEDGKKKLVPVAGTSTFSRNTAKYFDDVIYCEIKNAKHRVGSSTTYAGNILSGSRSDVALEKEEKPSLLKFFEESKQQVDQGTVALSALEKLRAQQKLGAK